MQDKKGLYYFPLLDRKSLKMYVRLASKDVEFRPWDDLDPDLWEEHGWVPYSAIQAASRLDAEEGRSAFPAHLYDIEIAIRLLRDAIEDWEE